MINLEVTKLREILEDKICANKDVSTHSQVLSQINGHTITVAIDLNDLEDDGDFNCVMYAFNVRLENPTSPIGRYYIGTNCLKRLIESGLLQPLDTINPPENSYAIYFDNERVVHIGLVTDNRYILSKWGMGNLYRHLPEEVPVTYGDTIKFYGHITDNLAMDFFINNCGSF